MLDLKVLPMPMSKQRFCCLFTGLCLVFSSLVCVYAQDDISGWEKKQVGSIDIVGNKTVSLATLIAKIKTKAGRKYSVEVARDDIKRLYAIGYFDDVRIDLAEVKGKLKVTFVVVEKPIVDSIKFKGVRHVQKRLLEDSMKTEEDAYLDKQKLRQDLEEIKRIYARRGYSRVEASFNLLLDEENNKVSVMIGIDEGLSARIRKVSVEGNETFSDSKIISLIKSKPTAWWLFRKGYFDDSVLVEDRERLLGFYRREGFSDVKVASEVLGLRRGWYEIVLKIEEGKRYYVGEVIFAGNESFSSERLSEHLENIIPEHIFSQESIEMDEFNIRSFYMDKGHIFAKVKGASSLNLETGKVDIEFKIMEDEIIYVNLIKIKGNVKTMDKVIRRELRIRPGERFDGVKLRRSRERLYNLGFFDELEGIDFDIEPTDKKNKSNLVVEVKETHTGTFSFGGGYSSIDQFVGFIEIQQKNFDWRNFPYFTGAGQDLRLRASMGSVTESFDLSFTEPWVFDYPVSFGFDAYRRQHERESDVGYGYDEDRRGVVLRLGRAFSEYWHAGTFYRIQEIEITDIGQGATTAFREEEGSNALSTLGLSVTYDSRDNVFDPRRGLRIRNSFETTGGPFGADKDFTKFWNSTSFFLPVGRNAVTMFKLRLGFANPFADSENVPIYERFFAGGAESIRGYNERKVGPIDTVTEDPIGGEALLIGNIEYMYPIWKHIKAAAFIDCGNVWRKMEDFASGSFKTGVGVGLRIKTPLGPFKLDYGYPLSLEAGEEEKEGQFHFSFSRGF